MKAEYLQLITSIIVSGGGLGGIYLLLKIRPEAGQITVSAAQGAVLVQTGVIDSLTEELTRLKELIVELKAENRELRSRIRILEGK